MGWTWATWTLTTDAPRAEVEAVLRALGLQLLLHQLDRPGDIAISLIGADPERPSTELERLGAALVERGHEAFCSLTKARRYQ